MPLSHIGTDGATRTSDHLNQILSDLGTELRRLSERAPAEQDFERFEGELHQLFATAERAMLALELEQLDVDRPAVTIAGQRHHRVLRATATYTSAAGPVTVLRTLYRAGCEQAAAASTTRNDWILSTLGRMPPDRIRHLLAGDPLLERIAPLLLTAEGAHWLASEKKATDIRFLLAQDIS